MVFAKEWGANQEIGKPYGGSVRISNVTKRSTNECRLSSPTTIQMVVSDRASPNDVGDQTEYQRFEFRLNSLRQTFGFEAESKSAFRAAALLIRSPIESIQPKQIIQ